MNNAARSNKVLATTPVQPTDANPRNHLRLAHPNVITAKNLCKSYYKGKIEVPVLKGVDLEIAEGDFTAIVGQSGSGKSTLLHLLGTLDAPDSGEIQFRDRRIDNLPARHLRATSQPRVRHDFSVLPLAARTDHAGKRARPAHGARRVLGVFEKQEILQSESHRTLGTRRSRTSPDSQAQSNVGRRNAKNRNCTGSDF